MKTKRRLTSEEKQKVQTITNKVTKELNKLTLAKISKGKLGETVFKQIADLLKEEKIQIN